MTPAPIKRHARKENDYYMSQSYKTFRKKYTDVKINERLYRDIIYAGNHGIAEAMITDSRGFRLPFNMGIMYVSKRIDSQRNADKKYSRQYGKRIYFINPQTQGFKCALRWVKDKRLLDNAPLYMYDATMKLKHRLYEAIINKETDYQEIT